MAAHKDPLEDLITSGRMQVEPYYSYSTPVVLDVDLDLLYSTIRVWLRDIYLVYEPLRSLYVGTSVNVNNNLGSDIDHMLIYLLWNCYNRLRRVAERFSTATRTSRLNPRAPCSDKLEFPTFLCSLVQSIGPLRIDDGPIDSLIIYAPIAGTMNHYGRNAAQNPIEGNYRRLIAHLKKVGVSTSTMDMLPTNGSAWTTCEIEVTDTLINVIGTIHKSHYVNEDIARAAFLHEQPALNPFQPIGSRVGYVDTTAPVDAVANAAPAGTPHGLTADCPPRPDTMIYNVNWYGLKPAIPAGEGTPAVPRGCYIIGRGGQRTYATYLARNLTHFDLSDVVYHRLTN